MKHPFLTITVAGVIGALPTALLTSPAHAESSMQESLRTRDDISLFYDALVATGVINELRSGPYTVFAPTNEAFAADVPQATYPCFYSAACRNEVADVLRNHIVPGAEYVSDISGQRGGVYSIDKRFVSIGEPHKDKYTADGHNIIRQNQLAGGILYKIDGVIANPQELALFRAPIGVDVATETQRVYYTPGAEPAGVSSTTTVTRTIEAAPAR